eukprot:Anaeramoba_ignava/c21240_g2_i1.p2 GENE.c21240_g2_i1~~c21240_g2_i1.p2  ORF type:complete len:253 (+),score=100.34 c21240_g2_i1:1431-2189(+)
MKKKISDQNHQKNEEIQQLKKQKEETETELNKLKEEEKKKPIVDQKELMALKMKSEKMQQLMMEKMQSQQHLLTEKIISLKAEICKLKGVEPTEENIEKVTGEKIIFIPKPTNLGGPLLNQVESPQNETEKIEPPTGGPPPPLDNSGNPSYVPEITTERADLLAAIRKGTELKKASNRPLPKTSIKKKADSPPSIVDELVNHLQIRRVGISGHLGDLPENSNPIFGHQTPLDRLELSDDADERNDDNPEDWD